MAVLPLLSWPAAEGSCGNIVVVTGCGKDDDNDDDADDDGKTGSSPDQLS